jgi:sulfate permease, SulP family
VFVPKLVTTLEHYDREQFSRDLVAGIIVGIVALPLSIAFAIASGVSPESGLYTAVVAGFLISALGGSRVQIGGPTGAFVVIIYGIVHEHGVDGLTVATLMAGALLVVAGLLKMGALIRFIPQPLITGFTTGIAVIIATGQLKDALGLRMGAVPAELGERILEYGRHIGTTDWIALAVTVATLAILIFWPRITHRIPGHLIAIIVTTAAVQLLDLPLETIGSRFGEINATPPRPTMPNLSFDQVRSLVGPAITIAMLGGIESLLSAVVSDGMIGARHRPNMELIGQGVANIASPLFGGIPATGALARTATNVKSGGRTPVAGIVHALTVLLITLFFGRWAALIPMATLAGILLVVAYQMSEWRVFRAELSSPREDVAVLLITFLLTALVDLTVAIAVGMVLSAFLFMKRMAEVSEVRAVTMGLGDEEDTAGEQLVVAPKGVEIYEIAGPFFFGATANFKDTLARVAGKPKVLILRMGRVPVIDGTGLRALSDVIHRSRRDGTLVLLAEVQPAPLSALRTSAVLDDVGEEHVCVSLSQALEIAQEELELRRLFRQRATGEVGVAP